MTGPTGPSPSVLDTWNRQHDWKDVVNTFSPSTLFFANLNIVCPISTWSATPSPLPIFMALLPLVPRWSSRSFLVIALCVLSTLGLLAHLSRVKDTADHTLLQASHGDDGCESGTISVRGLQHSPAFQAVANNTKARTRPIVSMASTAARIVSHQLATTLKSLVTQSYGPDEIRVYMATDARETWESYLSSTSGSWCKKHLAGGIQVKIIPYFVEDIGPPTKFVYALTDLVAKGDLDRPVVILDDDHYYSPDLLSTLALYSSLPAFRGASVGLRGWRVKRDCTWGVSWAEYDEHVVDGKNLDEVYRASVCTASDGYLVYPSWFVGGNGTASKSESVEDWAGAAIDASGALDTTRVAGTQAHLVDDIWMAGHLAAGGIKKYAVPLNIGYSRNTQFYYTKPRVPNVDLTTFTNEHSLESHMNADGYSRGDANTYALGLFANAWRAEGLWYDTRQDRETQAEAQTQQYCPSFGRVGFTIPQRMGTLSNVVMWFSQHARRTQARLLLRG